MRFKIVQSTSVQEVDGVVIPTVMSLRIVGIEHFEWLFTLHPACMLEIDEEPHLAYLGILSKKTAMHFLDKDVIGVATPEMERRDGNVIAALKYWKIKGGQLSISIIQD